MKTTRIVALFLTLAFATTVFAGTKVSQMRRTTTVLSNDLFMLVRTVDGKKTNYAIEARYLGPGLGSWITNAGGGSGEVSTAQLNAASNTLFQFTLTTSNYLYGFIGSGGGEVTTIQLLAASNYLWSASSVASNALYTSINVSSNALQTQVTAVTNGLNSGNTVYVRTNGNNGTFAKGRPDRPARTLAYALTQVASGDLIDLGVGVFDEGTSILDIPHGVSITGAGESATIIKSSNGDTAPTMTPGSYPQVIQNFTLDNRNGATNIYHQPFGTVGPSQGQKLATNFIVQNVTFIGDSCATYFETQLGEPTFGEFRRCTFISDHDGVFLLGPYSNLKLIDCIIRSDLSTATNLVAMSSIGRAGRAVLVGEGARVELINTSIFMTNHLTPIGVYGDETLGGSESRTQYLFQANSPMFLAATNGGETYYYQFNGWGTNFSANYQNVAPFPQSTSLSIFTNYPAPLITTMTATGNRTNWLPNIAKGGWNRFPNLIMGTRDGAGTAGTAPITIRPQAGQTIDGATSYSLNENHGEVYFRADPSGTNWVSHSVNGALLAGKQDGSDTLTSISSIGNIGFLAVTGPGTAAARELTVGNGLSIANSEGDSGNPLISLDPDDEAYGVGWNGSLEMPTKNAIYDKIEALSGVGEVNVNGEISITNATKIGLVYGKAGVTNLLRSLQAGNGIVKTNQGTNIVTAIDPAVVASQANITALSNAVVAQIPTTHVTASSTFGTDNRIIRSDGTGRGAQSTGITVDDSDRVAFPAGVLFQAPSTNNQEAYFQTDIFQTAGETANLGLVNASGAATFASTIITPSTITANQVVASNGVVLYEKPLTQSGTNLVADGSLSGSFSNNITANVGGVTNVLFINMVDGVTYDLWLSISPGVTVQLPQFASGTNWTGGRVPTFATNTVPVLIKATRRGVITNAVISQTDLVLENGPGVIAVTNFVTGKVTYMLDPVLTNLMGTVARNVTNENSTSLEINSGTLSITPGALSNLVNNTSINFQPGNQITNVGAIKQAIWTNLVNTTSNFVWSFNTNYVELKNQTNLIFTNIVEEATAVGSQIEAHIHNTTGVTMGLVWPAYGAQHGYFLQTNANNPIISTTSLASGAHGILAIKCFGTNIFATFTTWP